MTTFLLLLLAACVLFIDGGICWNKGYLRGYNKGYEDGCLRKWEDGNNNEKNTKENGVQN